MSTPETPPYVLVAATEEYDTPDVFGPFDTIADAQAFAENYREKHGLAREATPENNEVWTNAGWYFGIVPLTK